MNAKLDPTLLPALDAVQAVLERRPIYANDPRRPIDRRRLLDSMRKLDWEMRTRHYAPVIEAQYERDASEFFAAEQSPSDSTFR